MLRDFWSSCWGWSGEYHWILWVVLCVVLNRWGRVVMMKVMKVMMVMLIIWLSLSLCVFISELESSWKFLIVHTVWCTSLFCNFLRFFVAFLFSIYHEPLAPMDCLSLFRIFELPICFFALLPPTAATRAPRLAEKKRGPSHISWRGCVAHCASAVL